MSETSGVSIHAFGQVWHFSPHAMDAFGHLGMRTHTTLKMFIISVTPKGGLPVGSREITHHGIGFRIDVHGFAVEVDVLNR